VQEFGGLDCAEEGAVTHFGGLGYAGFFHPFGEAAYAADAFGGEGSLGVGESGGRFSVAQYVEVHRALGIRNVDSDMRESFLSAWDLLEM